MIRSRLHSLALATSAVLLVGTLVAGSAWAFEPDKYDIEFVSISLSGIQAGEHADLTVDFELTHSKEVEPFAATRDVEVAMPPGVFGNPQIVPQCTALQFGIKPEQSECPQDSQVGIAEVTLGGAISGTFIEPIFNVAPAEDDVVARLGFFAGPYPVIVDVKVDPIDYGLSAISQNASSAAGLVSVSTTLWGVPAAPSHDPFRITPEEALNQEFPPEPRESGLPEAPFMTNPTDCSLEREVSVTVVSYQLPDDPKTKTTPFPPITGCGKLSFAPKFTLTPTNHEAAAPTGVDAVLEIPQDETPGGRATSTLKSAVVTLPEGLTINPAAADGLASCSADEVHFEERKAAECPNAAKLGSAEIEVPALEHTLFGSIYQRTPGSGSSGSRSSGDLFRFWLVADEMGVHLKLPARIEANPLNGQITTFFLGMPALGGNPQVPVSELALEVWGGPRAPLATPSTCGTYQAKYDFAPWSGKPDVIGETPMQITSGCDKGGFAPGLQAGMVSIRAGSFAPFTMTLTRQDGESNPESLEVTLPQGLLAKLAGVPLCSDADAAAGTCPVGSKIGSVATAAGVGSLPLWIPQPGKDPTAAYLSGPYKGAPYSIVVVVPAQAGPFDLGTVVTRAAIHVDPESAVPTIQSDPLPQILEGVPVLYRTIHVDVDREGFTLNPTNCGPKQIKAHVVASDGAVADPTAAFQASGCSALPYSPKLTMKLKGQMKRSGNPSLRAVLTQPSGQANTARAAVVLPSSEFIDQSHINNPCTRVQFSENACPAKSVLGTARAFSPLLDQPLEGPVYFRSNGGERELPDIVADLGGQIHVTLVGFVDSVQKKGTEISRVRTTFANVPDAPVTKFVVSLYGGKRGLIENSQDLCDGRRRRVSVKMTGQNEKRHDFSPLLKTSCTK